MDYVWITKRRAFSSKTKAREYLQELHSKQTKRAEQAGKQHKPSAIVETDDMLRYSYCCIGYVVRRVVVE